MRGGPNPRTRGRSPIQERHHEHDAGSDHRGVRGHLVSLCPRRTTSDPRAAGPDRPHRRDDLGPSVAARIGERRAARSDGHLGTRGDLREQVAPELFRHLDVDRFPTSTLDTLALANRAYRSGFRVGERMSFAAQRRPFRRRGDISDRAVLESLACDLGVVMPGESDRADVLADWHEGVRRGVLGSPHFFCGDTDVFCPSLDITKDAIEGVSIVRDASRLTEFLTRCLAQSGEV